MLPPFLKDRCNVWLHRLAFLLLFIGLKANAQKRVFFNEINDTYTVKSVQIHGRWVPKSLQQTVENIIGVGGPFSQSKLSAAQEAIRNEYIKGEAQFESQILKGSTSVLFIYPEAYDSAKQLTIIIRPAYLRVDLFNIGNNILPIPRSAGATFLNYVPAALKATNPVIAFTSDRQYGPAFGLATVTDLLHLSPNQTKNTKFLRADLGIDARKSLTNSFYSFGSTLDLNHLVYSDSSLGWNISLQFNTNSAPLADGKNKYQNWNVKTGVQGATKISLLSKYAVGASARLLHSEFNASPGSLLSYEEKGLGLYALADGKPGRSFTRLALWFDAAIPDASTNVKSYQRLVSRIGYSAFLNNGHNAPLLEAMAGAGYTWGQPSLINQYFGGNSQRNFLYQPLTSMRNQTMPTGPLFRSLGENEAALKQAANANVGGTSFWHLNLNFSVPISKWSKPLIPDINFGDDGSSSTLATKLKGQVQTAQNFIYDDLVNNHGYPDTDATDSVAAELVNKDIRPTINYLADRANIYSVKPLLLFDVGQLNDHALSSKTFAAAGVGMQITIVIARLELGYMHTISPSTYSSKGNFFVNFVLQNFY